MARQCPPGVICIENITVLFLIVIIIGIVIFFHMKAPEANNTIQEKIYTIIAPSSNTQYKHQQDKNIDNLFNPYQPPMRMPINIRTQGNSHDIQYRQIGILTRNSGDDTILPLMGKILISNRSKWQYYTISDKNHVKLPIIYKNKSSMNEYGVDELFNGDTVYVQGYNDTFKITIYENNHNQYIPY